MYNMKLPRSHGDFHSYTHSTAGSCCCRLGAVLDDPQGSTVGATGSVSGGLVTCGSLLSNMGSPQGSVAAGFFLTTVAYIGGSEVAVLSPHGSEKSTRIVEQWRAIHRTYLLDQLIGVEMSQCYHCLGSQSCSIRLLVGYFLLLHSCIGISVQQSK